MTMEQFLHSSAVENRCVCASTQASRLRADPRSEFSLRNPFRLADANQTNRFLSLE